MTAQSIPELTNYEYNELSYNTAGTLITGDYIYEVCELINKCGIDIQPTNTYDYTVYNAVMQFQEMAGMTPADGKCSGILTTGTLQAMILYSKNINDVVESDDAEEDDIKEVESTSPHYNSFFEDDKLKIHRRNRKDIKIVFGNKSITKTIKDVFMRSVSVEVDTSGNPISEIYEFIARDIKESDEITDVNKYSGDEPTTSSDIPYDFTFIKPKADEYNDRNHGGGERKF